MDPLDSTSDGCLQAVTRPALFLSSVWIGCMAGGLAIGVAAAIADPLAHGPMVVAYVVRGPLLLFSSWFILSFVCLVAGFLFFARTERDLGDWWRNSAVLFSLLAVLGRAGSQAELWQEAVMWVCWLFNAAVIVGAVLFVDHWRSNRRAAELAHIAAYNAQKREEMRQRGIATFDPEPPDE